MEIFKISSESFNEQIIEFKYKKIQTNIKDLKKMMLFILSPDGFSSMYYKEELKKRFIKTSEPHEVVQLSVHEVSENKSGSLDIYYSKDMNDNIISTLDWSRIRIERKFFIEWSNWTNLILTATSCIIIYFLAYEFEAYFLGLTIYSFLIIRTVSRGIEIGLSFYYDVATINSKVFYKQKKVVDNMDINEDTIMYNNDQVYINGFRSSLLRSQGRLSLAMHTLIELFILFGALYFMTDIFSQTVNGKSLTPFGSLLFSTSLGVFNISYDVNNYRYLPQGAFHVAQALLSVVLILLSIAQYLGKNDEVNTDDQQLYRYVAKRRMYNKAPSQHKPSNDLKRLKILNISILYRSEIKIELFKNCIHINDEDGKPLIAIYDSGNYRILGNAILNSTSVDNIIEIIINT